MEWALGAGVVAVLLALYVVWLSGRISRLHARVAASHLALEAQLAHRANAAAALAHTQLVSHPYAAEQVCAAAKACLTAHPDEREAAENDLTRALTGLAIQPSDPAADAVLAATRRLVVARQVHNDAVRDTLGLRRGRLPRALRLGSRHPLPTYFDIAEPAHTGVGQPTPGAGTSR